MPKTITCYGETLTVRQWAARIGITPVGLHKRIANAASYGNDPERLLEPRTYRGNPKLYYKFGDETHTAKEWEAKLNLSWKTIVKRYEAGMDEADLLAGRRLNHPGRAKKVSFGGLELTQAEWAVKLGVSRERIRQRLAAYPTDEALGMVKHCGGRGKAKASAT